ncbi:MAG: hypothetical protein D6690_01530 [Nitrospirae bacterium]|nr:MAG: hypothetical protein D6690_01530 [Nitrospirota bacterium]
MICAHMDRLTARGIEWPVPTERERLISRTTDIGVRIERNAFGVDRIFDRLVDTSWNKKR